MDHTGKSKRDIALARIKALLQSSEDFKKEGSLEEAQSFAKHAAKHAAKLIAEYAVAQWEVDALKNEKGGQDFKNWKYNEGLSYADNQSGSRWKFRLICTICHFNFCAVVNYKDTKQFRVYGDMQHVDTVIWLYNFLSVGFLRLAQEKHVSLPAEIKKEYNRYAFLKDFLLGAVDGLWAKLNEQQEQMQKEVAKLGQLVIYNKEALDRYKSEVILREHGVSFVKNPKKPKSIKCDPNAYGDGYIAGKNYNITDPLTQGKTHQQLEKDANKY